MSYIDSVIKGTYKQGSHRKDEDEEESYVDKVINGTYGKSSYKATNRDEKKLPTAKSSIRKATDYVKNNPLSLLTTGARRTNSNEKESRIFNKPKEFEDNYVDNSNIFNRGALGKVGKVILGTGTDVTQDLAKGLISPIENVLDIGANVVATGLSTGSGALGIKNKKIANDLRDFANVDLSDSISHRVANATPFGALYNIANGTPEKIFNPAEVKYDKNKKLLENYKEGFKKAYLMPNTEEYEKSSVLGEKADNAVEMIGYSFGNKIFGDLLTDKTGTKTVGGDKLGASLSGGNIGLRIGNHTLNLPTLSIAGGMSGGLQEANAKANVSEAERWAKGISGGLIEGFSEGIFGALGVGGNDITDSLKVELAEKFSSRAGKMLAQLGIEQTGEAMEEFISYASNWLIDNGIINKIGNADFSSKWDWNDVVEQMVMAYVTTGISSGGNIVIENNASIKTVEQQIGRELSQQEKVAVTQAVIDGTLYEKMQSNNNGQFDSKDQQIESSEIAQNQNMDKINAELPVANENNRYTQLEKMPNNIENNQGVLYNNTESESDINDQRGIYKNAGRMSSILQQDGKSQQIRKYTKQEYENWEQSIKPTTYSELSTEQKRLKNDIERQYGKDIVFFDGNETDYNGGASLTDNSKIYVNRQNVEQFGINKIAFHEVMESNIRHNLDLSNDIINPAIESIMNDNNFQEQKNKFWSEQDGSMPSDYMIAKDILCDRFSAIKSGENLDYDNVLSQETNMTIDFAIENFENSLRSNRLETDNNQEYIQQQYLNTNFKSRETKTNFQDILVQKATDENSFTKTQERSSKQNKKEDNSTSVNFEHISDNNEAPTSYITKKNRKHYKSIIESNYASKEAKAIAKELMRTDTYVPESNNKQLEIADRRIATSSAEVELKSLMTRASTGGKIEATDIAVGERLIQYYSKLGDKQNLQEAIQATAMAGTTAGQTVQAMSLLNHQTPEGQAVWLQRSVEKMNNDLRKARGEKAEQFNLNADMIDKIVNSKNKEELQNNLSEVYSELGNQVTKTTSQKIDSWRYFSMLANPRTHIRNIVGNTAMGGIQSVKNKIAGSIEGIASKVDSKIERSHTVALVSESVKNFAKKDIQNVADRLGLNENKYNPKTRLENSMRTFKSDILEKTVGKAFELNNKALEAEDAFGLKHGYVKALSEYMTANKLTPDNITDKQLGKARNYAIEQAKEATFHQESRLASWLNQLSNNHKSAKFILDGALPFKKTPINVAKAGIEYSPVGLVKSAVYDTVKLRKGEITVNKYIDNISKGLTGTGIALAGYVLAGCGVLKASGSDDKDKEEFEEGRGSQNYSIRIGDNTYSLDWLAPSGIPLFIGAECYEIMQADKEKKSSSSDEESSYNQAINSATNLLDAFTNAMNPMTEMSMLSGLSSALKSYDQGSSKVWANIGTNITKSYVNQFIPTAVGQIAKTTDKYERSTTSTKTGVLPKAIDTTKNQIMNKIPGLRQQLPIKTDTWGNDIEQPNKVLQRTLENSVVPWSRKEIASNDVDKAIIKLYDSTGSSSVLPDGINKNLTIDTKKYVMTSDEYAKYKKQYGSTSYNLLSNLIKSKDYKKMNSEQKQHAIEKVYSYVNEQIKLDYAKQNKLDCKETTLSKTANAMKKAGGNVSNYFEYLALTKDLDKDNEKLKVLTNANFSQTTKKVIYENSIGKDDKDYVIMKKVFDLKQEGLDINDYLDYKQQKFEADRKDDGTVKGKSISGSKKDKVIDYINSIKGASYTQKMVLYALEYKPEKSDRDLVVNFIQSNWKGKEQEKMLSRFSWITIYKDGRIKY